MSPESQAPNWEWYYIAMYFYLGGVSAGAFFIGSLLELVGKEKFREVSRIAYQLAFPLICITPILLIADLGRPERFWHLFFYTKEGIPYMNLSSPLSVGTWALLAYGFMSFLAFLNVMVVDGRIRSSAVSSALMVFNRAPGKVYAALGSFFGFFVAGYTGVLVNTTARPLWEAADPLFGPLFIASAASTGAAAIALGLAWSRRGDSRSIVHLESFDRVALIAELTLIVAMIFMAGKFAAPLLTGFYGIMFLGGAVLLGIIVPLGLNLNTRGMEPALGGRVMLISTLVLLGGAFLRISLLQAGQI